MINKNLINLIEGKSLVKELILKLSAHFDIFTLKGSPGLGADSLHGSDVQHLMFVSTAFRNVRQF